ncbi:hypothetical protein G6F64_015451 [Rhizopus arrhizus]|uniref:Uncharacterized protein n=1 Tax=Rhizopus oryzae TaxID=64495 RepID=A0A9P7BIG7_RHIOR|nr:hypothetical protein G6F31_017966 [Rhizopus arrhizus]KAG1272884.1 hypothetical protein G6F64_015451 [Rhizopus arrhizus]
MPSTALSAMRSSIHNGSSRYSSGWAGAQHHTAAATSSETTAAATVTALAVTPMRYRPRTAGRNRSWKRPFNA